MRLAQKVRGKESREILDPIKQIVRLRGELLQKADKKEQV